MFCKHCGAQLREGALFCTKCGARITITSNSSKMAQSTTNSAPVTPTPQAAPVPSNTSPAAAQTVSSGTPEKKGKNILPFIIMGAIILLLLAIIIALVIGNKKNSTNNTGNSDITAEDQSQNSQPVSDEPVSDTEAAITTETEDAQSTEAVAAEASTAAVENESDRSDAVYTQFGINPATIEDYSTNLNPETYLTYNSDIDSFHFSYPANLYNTVSCNTDATNDAYGTNVTTINFKGSNNSELIFKVSRRTDGDTYENITEKIHASETGRLTNPSDIQVDSDEGYGKVILTGYDHSGTRLVYDLIRIEQDYVYQMFVVYPSYTSDDDKLQKDYVTECIYRMCGFSGSTKEPQTYDEYSAYWRD